MASEATTVSSTATGNTTSVDMDWVNLNEAKEETGATEATTTTNNNNPKDEEQTEEPPAELDLVFICDNTGSMGRWIRSAQENIRSIVRDISNNATASASSDETETTTTTMTKTDVRFALVSYRDHPPQDKSWVTKTHDFTSNVNDMQRWVNEMKANGGGDFPEAVAAALYDASQLTYRPNSTKVAVLIADAPPHGLGIAGDGFPNGCPLGHDPLEITRNMAADGITIYTVICGNFEGQAFYQGVAQITGGQYIPIRSAHLLASVIVGGAQEEISLERLMDDVQRAVEEEEDNEEELDDELLASKVHRKLFLVKKSKMAKKTRQTKLGDVNLPDYDKAAEIYSARKATLKGIRESNKSRKSHLSLGSFGSGMDAAIKGSRPDSSMTFTSTFSAAGPSHAQCKRMVAKSKARISKKKSG